MDAEAVTRYIRETFDGLDDVEASDDVFFFYDPDRSIDPARRLPFATIVTSDAYDQFSNLDRPAVYRLNFGLSQDTYVKLFGQPSPSSQDGTTSAVGDDFTALDRIMPHPVYRNMFWACVLNPSEATFDVVRPLLGEAYNVAIARTARGRKRQRPVES
jgi:Family of unknown function (DUF6194)